jgi:hypothetical protein
VWVDFSWDFYDMLVLDEGDLEIKDRGPGFPSSPLEGII